MDSFIFQPVLAAISTVVYWVALIALSFRSYALQPKPAKTRNEPGKFEIPTIKPGVSIPVVFGTVMIRDPSIVWWGDLRTTPIIKSGGKK